MLISLYFLQMNLKMLKAFHTFQEDIIKAFAEGMDHTDMTLVSSTGQEVPCHRFILSTRSEEFGKMFGLLGTQVCKQYDEIVIHFISNALFKEQTIS